MHWKGIGRGKKGGCVFGSLHWKRKKKKSPSTTIVKYSHFNHDVMIIANYIFQEIKFVKILNNFMESIQIVLKGVIYI